MRYPLVELFTCIVSFLIVIQFGLGWVSLCYLVFTWSLLSLAFIDFDTQLLPDSITLPLLWAGLTFNATVGPVPLEAALSGALIGYLSLWSIFWAFKLITGKEGMGYGDFKLLAAIGAWLGWQALPMTILLSSVVGLIIGGGLILLKRNDRSNPFAFGPFLAISGWLMLILNGDLPYFL